MTDQQLYKTLLLGEYKIALKMKQGAFGTVYLAKNKAGKEFAIKISKGKNSDEITTEKQIYSKLSGAGDPIGFIKYYESGEVLSRSFIVMELLGSDLDDLFIRSSLKRFSLKTSLMIGLHVLDRLEVLHGLGYIHRDIKPDNLAVGIRDLSRRVYLIDFGLSKKLNFQEKQPKKSNSCVGTYRFMSVNSHNGLDLSQRDDIESLCYLIVFLIEGRLPWQGNRIDTKQGIQNIKKGKLALNIKDLSRPVPDEVFQMLKYARELKFNATPNYELLRELLMKAMKKNNFHDDTKFDWVKDNGTPEKHRPEQRRSKPKSPPKIKQQKPTKKKGLLNEIDREIVAVFKFCNHNDLISTVQDVVQRKQPEIPSKTHKHLAPIPPPSRQNKFRPQSAQKPAPFDARLYTRNQPTIDFQGPRIVINKQAKYKI